MDLFMAWQQFEWNECPHILLFACIHSASGPTREHGGTAWGCPFYFKIKKKFFLLFSSYCDHWQSSIHVTQHCNRNCFQNCEPITVSIAVSANFAFFKNMFFCDALVLRLYSVDDSMINKCGVIDEMRNDRGNRSTRKIPTAVPFYLSQILHYLTEGRNRVAAIATKFGKVWGRFSSSISVSPANHSTNFSIIIITRGCHNRPIDGCSAEWTQLDSSPTIPIN
jgi:hypothetical protein